MQRLQEDAVIAHGQVAALHQRNAEIARQVCMFEVGFVVGAWSQQHEPGRLAVAAWTTALQRIEQAAEARRQPLHLHASERFGKQA